MSEPASTVTVESPKAPHGAAPAVSQPSTTGTQVVVDTPAAATQTAEAPAPKEQVEQADAPKVEVNVNTGPTPASGSAAAKERGPAHSISEATDKARAKLGD